MFSRKVAEERLKYLNGWRARLTMRPGERASEIAHTQKRLRVIGNIELLLKDLERLAAQWKAVRRE